MTHNRQTAHRLGHEAEAQAAEYLKAKGYNILALRLRTKGGEIDVLAKDGDTVVVVEVKARASLNDSLYSITPAKRKRLTNAGWALMAEPEIAGLGTGATLTLRFDMVAVAPGLEPLHIEDAWREE